MSYEPNTIFEETLAEYRLEYDIPAVYLCEISNCGNTAIVERIYTNKDDWSRGEGYTCTALRCEDHKEIK